MKKNLAILYERVKKDIHFPLLAFLLIFTIDKITLKFLGILLIYALQPDFNFRKNIKKIPAFYLLIVGLELVKFLLLNKDFSKGHTVSFLLGCAFWIISFLCLHQFRSIIDKSDEKKIDQTLKTFFIINCTISFFNLLLTIYHSGSLNPYALSDPDFGNSTGDFIKGLFMGPSYINMMISSFFIFYFLYKKNFGYALFALLTVLLTTSNFGNLVLFPVLVACFIFRNDRQTRAVVASFIGLFVLFYLFASPNNFQYLKNSIWVPEKSQQELVAYEKAAVRKVQIDSLTQKITVKMGSVMIAKKIDYDPGKVTALVAAMKHDTSLPPLHLTEKYGKLQAFKETKHYLLSNPKTFIFGSGIGGFSSFLATRMSGVDGEEASRLFHYLPSYASPEFSQNHYLIYKTVYGLPKAFHSVKHFPNSFLNQLAGEYGLAGILLFLFTYVLFFIRHYRRLSYGKYLLFLLGGFLFFDYLFEYLSVVTVFELLMLCDIKQALEKPAGDSITHSKGI